MKHKHQLQAKPSLPVTPAASSAAPSGVSEHTQPNQPCDRRLLIPILHENVKAESFYRARKDFFTHYDKTEENEGGCLFDLKTGKPTYRVVFDITHPNPRWES